MKIKITKEIISAVVSVISAVICSVLAGCRLVVGELEVEFAGVSTNVIERIVK